MTTSDEVTRVALGLAHANAEPDVAVGEILTCSGGRRVSVVLARQHLAAQLNGNGAGAEVATAVTLLDRTLAEAFSDQA